MSQSRVMLRIMHMSVEGTTIVALEPIRYQGKRIRYKEATPCIATKERPGMRMIDLPPVK